MAKKTDLELRDGLRLLSYECSMLVQIWAFCNWDEAPIPSGQHVIKGVQISNMEQFMNNVLLESFLVHARNLIAFFRYEKGRRYSRDIYAADYFKDSQQWARIRGKMPKELVDVQGRANTRLAHINLQRTEDTPENKGWDLGVIASTLKPLSDKFYSNIREDLNKPEP